MVEQPGADIQRPVIEEDPELRTFCGWTSFIGVALRQSLSEDLTVLSLPLGSLVVFLVIAVVFGVLAAIVPAIRASRMKVLDAIATE